LQAERARRPWHGALALYKTHRMSRWFTSAKLIVIGAFLFASLAAVGYEMYFVWPAKRCDERGAWWDDRDHQCLTPMPIWRITGRGLANGPPVAALPPGDTHRVAAGAQSTSPAPLSLAKRAATNNRSDSRLR
jgi:hypothetical protein